MIFVSDLLSRGANWFKNKSSSVGRKTQLGLGVLLALSLLAWIATNVVVENARRESTIVRASLLVRLSLEDVLSTLKDAETGQRGYLLTGDSDYLTPYREARDSIQNELAALEGLTADNAADRQRVQKIEQLSAKKMAELDKTIELSRVSGLQAAMQLVRTQQDKHLMEEIRTTARALKSEQLSLIAAHAAALGRASNSLNERFLLGYVLFVFTALAIYRTVRKYSQQAERAEFELRRVNAGLEQLVEERTASLREQEERLRLAQDAAHVASWELDLKRDTLSGSAEFNAFFNLAPGEALSRADWTKLLDPADSENVENALSHLLRGEELQEVEFRIRHADGRTRWHLAKGAGFRRDDGAVTRALGVSIDITDRKEAEANLRANEELLRTFVRYVPAAVSMLDRELRYLQVSERWSTMCGIESCKVLHRSIDEVFPNLPQRWRDIHATCLRGESARGEDVVQFVDGRRSWLKWEIRPWGDSAGEPQGLLLFSEDVTERRRTEEQLRIRTDALENALTAFCLVAEDGKFIYANRTYVHMWGYDSLSEIIGAKAETHSADPALPASIAAQIASRNQCTIEFPARRKGGSTFHALMTIQASMGLDGNQIYICAALDITERKRVEVALRESEAKNRLLLETLRQSEDELRALAGSLLTVQEEERRRIARDLHDDITQELAAVSIDIGTLAATCPAEGHLIPRLRSLQGRITEVCSLVRHVSHGLHPSMLEDLGLSAALEAFCEEFSEMEGIRVDYEGDEDDDALSVAEASCLYRIAQESLRNVAKHAKASHVKVELRNSGDMVRLSIWDNGVGIGAISSGARERAGLGLISMKERMRLINGTLSVISSPGEGTRVIGCVPLRVIGCETIAHTASR